MTQLYRIDIKPLWFMIEKRILDGQIRYHLKKKMAGKKAAAR